LATCYLSNHPLLDIFLIHSILKQAQLFLTFPEASLNTRTDVELVRQLEQAAASKTPVEAVVRLKPDDASQIVPDAERTEAITKQLLERVGKHSGKKATRYNVFRNLGSFVVSADAGFIRELMSQPEVASIAANQQPGSALIEPINKKPVADLVRRKPQARSKGAKVSSRSSAKKSTRKATRRTGK
jgi:hypothetical protein